MKTRIAKDFRWEMSHRLPGHNGLCRNLHGHSYALRVELEGQLNSEGMLIDYYDMKQIVMPIIDRFDHSFVCSDDDELMINFLKQNDFKHLVLGFPSTAEHLAKYLLELVTPEFAKFSNIHKISIRLFETKDVYAEVSADISGR